MNPPLRSPPRWPSAGGGASVETGAAAGAGASAGTLSVATGAPCATRNDCSNGVAPGAVARRTWAPGSIGIGER